MATAAGGRNGPALVLTQLVQARQITADLRLQFTTAADASNRAVMADTDDASKAAADEAEKVTLSIQKGAAARTAGPSVPAGSPQTVTPLTAFGQRAAAAHRVT